MLIHCQHCHTPFTLAHENIITALDQLEDNGWKHYNAYCPRCGRANIVGREQLMKAAPEWTPTGLVNPRPEPVTTPSEAAAAPKPVQAAPKPAAKPAAKVVAKQAKKVVPKTRAAKKPTAKKAAPKAKKPAAKPKTKAKPKVAKKKKK